MVAFAVGGLLGDTLFHLLPEIFLGEVPQQEVRFVMVEPNKNLLLGVAIMVGFVTFVAMDKGLRIATGGDGGHEHGHAHAHATDGRTTAVASGVEVSKAAKLRKKENGSSVVTQPVKGQKEKEINASVKLAGYLNLMYVFFLPKVPLKFSN
jgi:zinc transporter 7